MSGSKLPSPRPSRMQGQIGDRTDTGVEHTLPTYANDEPGLLANLMLNSEESTFAILFEKLKAHKERAVPLLKAELTKEASFEAEDAEKDQLVQRQARAAVALVRLGEVEGVWPLLQHSPDPSLRSYIVNWLSPLGAEPKSVEIEVERIRVSPSLRVMEGRQQVMNLVLFHSETSERRALTLALGKYREEMLSPSGRKRLVAGLLEAYRNDPDAGIHGATEWTLRRWADQDENLKKELSRIDESLKNIDKGEKRWYVNGQGQTFSIIKGPVEFRMGSPKDEHSRSGDEAPHKRLIGYSFAIATKEVADTDYNSSPGIPSYSNWYEAAEYCNKLSMRRGSPPGKEWCYLPDEKGRYGDRMSIPEDQISRKGYRLPTEAEWEYACRAGSITSRPHGISEGLLREYAWYTRNSGGDPRASGSLLPNDLGLFDMLGNVNEWCQDQHSPYKPDDNGAIAATLISSGMIGIDLSRVQRGGCYTYFEKYSRSAYRGYMQPTNRYTYVGFRIARTYP